MEIGFGLEDGSIFTPDPSVEYPWFVGPNGHVPWYEVNGPFTVVGSTYICAIETGDAGVLYSGTYVNIPCIHT